MYHGPRGVPRPWGVPWPSRGVPWPLYEEYALEPNNYLYWRPFLQRFAYAIAMGQMSVCLSVTLVYCGQTVGWIKMPLGKEVDHSPAGHTVLDWDQLIPRKGAQQPPLFGP